MCPKIICMYEDNYLELFLYLWEIASFSVRQVHHAMNMNFSETNEAELNPYATSHVKQT
jgi:hypothetical protein